MNMFLIYLVLQGTFLWSHPPPSERGEGTLTSTPAAPKQLEHWPQELHDACGQFDLHSERWRMYARGSLCPRLTKRKRHKRCCSTRFNEQLVFWIE